MNVRQASNHHAERDWKATLRLPGNVRFVTLTNLVLDVADTYAGGTFVSVLDGGYGPAIFAGKGKSQQPATSANVGAPRAVQENALK
jgi:hypothetical protein